MRIRVIDVPELLAAGESKENGLRMTQHGPPDQPISRAVPTHHPKLLLTTRNSPSDLAAEYRDLIFHGTFLPTLSRIPRPRLDAFELGGNFPRGNLHVLRRLRPQPVAVR